MSRTQTFRVWAPGAKRVELVRGARRSEMTPAGRGWWALAVECEPETDYAFALDGAETAFPDPRSPRQPHGVHGASRTVAHESFVWHDDGFQAPPLGAALLYELHVGTFTPEGTFDGVITRLDHLKSLGVTHVELMPVNAFPGAYGWGYDGVALYAPFEPYGGPEGLKRLVDACHARGLGVALDVVYNHLGPSGNYLGSFGPYFTERYRTPWGSAVNLDDAGSDEVRRFIIDNAKAWIRDYHVDALRLDAVHAIFDGSATHLLEELAFEVHTLAGGLGRHVALIAESDLNDPRLLRSPESGGYGLDAQWSDDFHHAVHALLTGERHGYYADFGSLQDVKRAFEQVFVYAGRHSAHRDRRHGRAPIGLAGDRFVVFVQNHDQVGNRARGERLGHLVSPGRVKVGAALLLASPFVPLLFQGEEWSASAPFQYFTAHDEPELAEAVREGRRREFAAFGWSDDVPDPQARETYERSKLDWSELDREPHREILAWYRELIALRRTLPDLREPRLERTRVTVDEVARWLVLQRGDVVVATNLGDAARPVPLPDGPARALRLASDASVRLENGAVVLGPDAVAVLAPAAL